MIYQDSQFVAVDDCGTILRSDANKTGALSQSGIAKIKPQMKINFINGCVFATTARFSSSRPLRVRIISIVGKKLYHATVKPTDGNLRISTSIFAKVFYLISIIDDNGFVVSSKCIQTN